MKIEFQILDCDYTMLENYPVVRIFGKTHEKTVCAFYKKYFPYFYILPKKELEEKLKDFLKSNFNNLVLRMEETEKFLPIGFQKEKTKLVKIFLSDPSKVPSVRESLREQKFVEEIFEADILFKYRFMADFFISGMKWVKIEGKSTNTKTVKTDEAIEIENIEEIENESNVDSKYMAFDIEVIPSREGIPDARKDAIALISIAFFPAYEDKNSLVLISKPIRKFEKDVLVFEDEKTMLQEFLEIIEKFDPDFFVGYNINNFDFPYLIERLKTNKLSCAIGRCSSKQAIARKVGTKYRNSVVGRVIVDVYDLVRESIKKGALRLKRLGLGDVSKGLLNEEKIDIAHSEIGKYWNGSELEVKKLIDYARKDAELALKILLEKKMLDKFIGLSKVSGLLLQDTLDGGEASRVENLLLREFNKEDFVLPCKPSKEILKREEERKVKELKGALVLEPKVGLHTNCVIYMDFKAMYPSLFIAYNICTSTLLLSKEEGIETIRTPYGTEFVSPTIKKGIIPRILQFLIKERDRVKEKMKQAKTELERRNLDAKQYAMKIMANAFYGYTGYIRARLYVLDIANAITSCGREFIKKTKEIVEKDPSCEVIYGDTDSLLVKTQTVDLEEALKKGIETEQRVNQELEGKIQMKIESVFKSLLILTKKRYAGLSCEKVNEKWAEEITMKGIETVRRDWCDLTEETLYKVLDIILKEQDTKKAFNYVKDVLYKIEKNQIPVEKLAITKGISKPLKEYKGIQPHIELVKKLRKRSPATAPGVGDRVSFVVVKGLELLSQRAEDPEYVKKHGLKIDSRYYIESQVLPPLERVFEVIGISKSELIGIGRQLILSEAIRELKKPEERILTSLESFVCEKCNQAFRRVPLTGRCNCGGEVVFYSNGIKARYLSL